MLSVIIATRNSERTLVATLAALVPGATCGLVAEVILADGGSRDDTAAVADVAGCQFMALDGPEGARLKAAAAAARAPWLMFLRPGTVPGAAWTTEVGHFIAHNASAIAAVFRRGTRSRSAWRQMVSLLSTALGAQPRPEQGLVIAKAFYETLGGHAAAAADPETELLRRIGRARLVTLSTGALIEMLD